MDLIEINNNLKNKKPEEIISWALNNSERPVLTTNFRPYEAAILNAVTKVQSDLKVIWCDTGYNTPNTYRHARDLIEMLQLNISIFVPQISSGYRDVLMGIPSIDHPLHKEFTEQVKLEPFRRAMK